MTPAKAADVGPAEAVGTVGSRARLVGTTSHRARAGVDDQFGPRVATSSLAVTGGGRLREPDRTGSFSALRPERSGMTEHARTNVAPATLAVELDEGGVAVEYLDGREAYYHGVPEPVAESVRTTPRRHVHVLVTDPDGTEGVMTYVNDRTTHDDVLESTGVGRLLFESNESEELFPGVTVEMDGLAAVVSADHDLVDGRVFVFEEDEMGERSFEVVEDGEVGGVGDGSVEAGSSGDAGRSNAVDDGDS